MKKKDKVIKVGVTRAAELFDRTESTITRRCKSGRLVARQEFEGAQWEIFIPEEVYLERKKILELKMHALKTT